MKNDGKFASFGAEELRQVLSRTTRQYLVGNLTLPQDIEFIRDREVEIGITRYENETSEVPHWHSQQREYQYMLSGRTTYVNSLTGEGFEYKAGDFYAILPEICYKQHSAPDTIILFIKHPSVNDKVLCRRCEVVACPSRIEPFSGEANVPKE